MRDSTRLTRKPWQRENIVAVRERLQSARERLEEDGGKVRQPAFPGCKGCVLDVCCEALYTALLVFAWDRESAQDIVCESLVLLQAERDLQSRGG